MKLILWIVFVVLILLGGGVIYFVFKKRHKGHLGSLLKMTLFLVTLPRKQSKETEFQKSDFQSKIAAIEQFYNNFNNLKNSGWKKFIYGQPRITVEIGNTIEQKEVAFYIAVPKTWEQQAKYYLQGIYPQAQISISETDYNPYVPQGKTVGGYLLTSKSDLLPIKTYKELSIDPLAQLTNVLASIQEKEGAAFQIVIHPASQSIKSQGKAVIKRLQEGESFQQALHDSSLMQKLFKAISKLINQKKDKLQDEKNRQPDSKLIELIQTKQTSSLFEVNVRILASSQDENQAANILEGLKGVFDQFTLTQSNSFKFFQLKKKALKRFFFNFSLRAFDKRKRVILNSSELASLYHLSLEHLETPYIKKAQVSEKSLPIELTQKGPVQLGVASFRDKQQNIYFASEKDRRRHFYVIGQTGTGKTSLLQEMIRQDVQAGRGVGVVDPHGDLIEAILSYIPENRQDDVILFEPFDTERPVGLNMLEYQTEEQKDFAVQEMIAIFQKLFPPEVIGPMFEHYMRNAMLALMANKDDPGTLVEIPRIFTDTDFMEKKILEVKDPVVKQFWEKEWRKTTGQTRSDMLGYVVSKVGRFIENSMMRNIIGQARSGFDLSKVMNEGKIFLANLSKGQTGEVNSSLLGLILVSKFQIAAMRRGEMPEDQRKDFYLYADEFQNFTTDSIPTILSEARKYRLNLILAHQFIAQLQDNIRDAVFGNVGSIMSFRIGVEDAERLAKQFEPDFTGQDLVNLPNFEAVVKLVINNQVSPAFQVKTVPPQEGNINQISQLKKLSKDKYARNRLEVEQEIQKRANLGQFTELKKKLAD
jgi:hypothetical protein